MTEDENDVIIKLSVNLSELSWPGESALATEEYFVRGYQDMRGLTWDDACETLKLEKKLIDRYPGDLSDAEESVFEKEEDVSGLYGLDLGIVSTVVALSAAGCAPVASCNGASGHHEAYPLVAFCCRKGRVRDILKATEIANCGLYNGESGALVVYGGNVKTLMKFAEVLIAQRESLKPLSNPNQKSIRGQSKKYHRKRDKRQLAFDIPQ